MELAKDNVFVNRNAIKKENTEESQIETFESTSEEKRRGAKKKKDSFKKKNQVIVYLDAESSVRFKHMCHAYGMSESAYARMLILKEINK